MKSPGVLLTRPDVREWADGACGRIPTTPLHRLAHEARAGLGPEAGPTALTLARLWIRHSDKFPTWSRFIADRIAFEQASGERPALWRARRFSGCESVLDLCSGAGADTVALSLYAERIVAVDLDEDRITWARENVRAFGRPERTSFMCADVTDRLPDTEAAVLDPDRRASGRGGFGGRAVSAHDYSPPVEAWDAIRRRVATLAVKVAPGMPYGDVPEGAVAEYVEDRGECREAVLWFGERGPEARSAVVLDPDDLGRNAVLRADEDECHETGALGSVLYDPGPATVRAHLVTHLAAKLGARRIDPQIAYLTGEDAARTPFAAAFRVVATMPFSLRRLREALAERRIGALEIRTRRFPIRPDDLRPQLRLAGENAATLILTRIGGKPTAIIGEPVTG